MKKTIAFILMMSFLGAFNVPVSAETVKNIYVSSLTGSDSNKGITEDKPFKTLEKAMSKATSYKTTGADVVNIFMDDGVYELSETMNIVAGNDKTTINYKAKGDVIFKGSKVIPVSAFSFLDDEEIKEKLNDDIESNVYVADISEIFPEFDEYHTGYHGSNAINYYQFYHNDSEMNLARYPNEGYMSGSVVSGSATKLKIPEEKAALWASSGETVRVNGYLQYDWAYARTYITEFDTVNSIIDIHSTGFEVSGRNKFYVFDILEELDSLGEWYIDRENGKIYYYPKNSMDENDVFEITSMKKQMIDLSELKNVTFEGITFEKTRGYAVYGEKCNNVAFKNCYFKDIGRDAINLSGEDISISGCTFRNMGGRGVVLTGGDNDTLTESGNIIEHCEFDGMGKTFKAYNGAVKISGCGNTVINNTMKNATHQMIGYGGTLNKILFNDIDRACTDSGDMGAIYSGRSAIKRGNEIAYNYIKNTRSDYSDYHLIAGIYMDDGLCGQYIHHNVIKNANVGIHLASGSDNSTHNNIILDCDSAITLSQGNGKEDNSKAIFEEAEEYLKTNSLYLEKFPTLRYIDSNKTLARGNFIHDNLIVNSGCKLYDGVISALSFGEGARNNRRYNNLLVDEFSDFKDAENGNYEITEDSEILADMPELSLIKMNKIGKDGLGGEYSYIPHITGELNSAIDSLQEHISAGEYKYFDTVDELFAKAEVNGMRVDEFKNREEYLKYLPIYEKYNEFICYDVPLEYNYGNTYTSVYNSEGGAGFSGAFFRDDFINNLNWKNEWTDDITDNYLYSFNEKLGKDISFFMRVPDYNVVKQNCVVKNDSTYKTNKGKYFVIDVTDGYYETAEILANSDRPTKTSKAIALRLDYSDGSHEYQEYNLNYFANNASSEAVSKIETTRTWADATCVEDLYDLTKRPAGTTGKIGHYSIPVDDSKKLESISVLNDKYDWKTDENGEYVKDENGEYIVIESEYSNRSNYKRTATVYALTLTTNGILADKADVFTPKNLKIYNKYGFETDLQNDNFEVKGTVLRNTESDEVGVLYIAVYSGDVLKAVRAVEISGETEVSEKFEITEWGIGERRIKYFIWNDNMQPLYR